MKILTYARVSTPEQTLEPQWMELRERATKEQWTILAEHSDVLGGGRAARPGLDALRARCSGGGVDAVVVVKLDRLGRSLLNVVRLVEELDTLGVAVICTSQGIDTRKSSPCGRMVLQIMAAFAEFEKSIIVERTVAGLKSARSRGVVLGRPSPTLVGADRRGEIVGAWQAEGRPGGLRELGVRLGCSAPTAGRVVKECAAAVMEVE